MTHAEGRWRRRAGLLAAALIVAACAARLPLLGGGQIDYDEGVYWASLRSMDSGHALFSSVYSSQPPAFLGAMVPFFALGHSIAAARSGVLLFFALGLAATYVAVRVLLGSGPALLAVVLLAVDPLMLRQSVALQADGPATAVGMVALAAAALASRAMGRRALLCALVAGMALACAVLVKLLAVVFAVPAVLVIILGRGSRRVRGMRIATMLLGAMASAGLLLVPYLDRFGVMWSQVVGGHISARSLHEGGLLTFDMALALARESPFYLCAQLGAALLWHRAPRVLAALAAWAAAVITLALLQHPLWPHHLVVASPLAAVAAAGIAAHPWWRSAPMRARTALLAAGTACVAAAGLATGLHAFDHPGTADTLTGAVRALQQATRPGQLVTTDDPYAVAAAGRDTPAELVDSSFVRIDSQPLTPADIEAITVRDGVAAVYVGTDRLPHIPGLLDWVRAHFPSAIAVRGGGVIYTR